MVDKITGLNETQHLLLTAIRRNFVNVSTLDYIQELAWEPSFAWAILSVKVTPLNFKFLNQVRAFPWFYQVPSSKLRRL